ncbi:hypothetical protein Ssi03_25950 [Sphaerisporangium siamense]|uniref:Htaa domain-containing protein n=1 Tax=Sphaerisporangium siamense TaxID=795645 RepID=A0A7W7D4G6_9ACTN|nr:hypothetical protein [Sphaerisporangium siamense]MBB4700078.1 hypothetical protein [Sphaerisporangium siamense]GII84605.1 hypothetical protein Ssi03_25950 [Sphaerisporangium siamense]
MAWSASGLFVATHIDQWDASNLGIDLTAETHKAAFWGSSVTPNFDTDTAYNTAPWNSGQSSGAGYTAGGPLLTGTTLAAVSGSMRWDADNIQLDNSTITAEGLIIYAPANSSRLISATWFGAVKETQDGTFLITWHANGIAALDLTP